MKTEKFINALFAMVEAKMEYNRLRDDSKWAELGNVITELDIAKNKFDKAFMEAVDSHIKETSKN